MFLFLYQNIQGFLAWPPSRKLNYGIFLNLKYFNALMSSHISWTSAWDLKIANRDCLWHKRVVLHAGLSAVLWSAAPGALQTLKIIQVKDCIYSSQSQAIVLTNAYGWVGNGM